MREKRGKLPIVYLHPGEYRFSKTPEVVSTILGSCVSLTMYVKRLKIGAMTHAVLPDNSKKNEYTSGIIDNFKYVDKSIHTILEMFDGYNVKRSEIEIKIFGGADLFRQTNENTISIGVQNVKSAMKILNEENLSVSASDVGGFKGRKLYFFTDTGEIYLKYLGK